MKKCFVITFYDEHEYVLKSIQNITKLLSNTYICCVHSFDKQTNELNQIKKLSNSYIQLPNLGKQFSKFELPSQCICRNYSAGFSDIYKNVNDIEYIAALTGDTLVTDANNFSRLFSEIQNKQIIAKISQKTVGFCHDSTDDPINGIVRNRLIDNNTTDFACCFFIIDGNFAKTNKAFSDISITNKWTSEQCLGDEMLKYIDKKDFHQKIHRLNQLGAYSYNDGIKYHAKSGRPSGRK